MRTTAALLSLLAGYGLVSATAAPTGGSNSGWAAYEGDAASSHFAGVDELSPANVDRLKPAWTFDLGDSDSSAEPMLLGDRLIVVGGAGTIAALDPATGTALWKTDTKLPLGAVRGFSYWRSKDGKEERLLFAAGQRLRALDPATGALISGFDVDLREGLGRDPATIGRIAPPTPGRVFEDLIIMGSVTGENYEDPPGHVRAYDVRTGALVWTFRTIPSPSDEGDQSWPADAWKKAGGANVWGGMSVDDARGIAYFVTGSATYDFYGADRKGDNLYANSLVAVDARTGRRLWHFQTVHHDLWDYDLTASPVLMTLKQAGKPVPAVVIAGKTGFVYAFDRVTGKPLWPIPERAVPQSDVPGEYSSPTQPMPQWPLPFARQSFTEADIDPALDAEERAAVIAKLTGSRNEGIFTPPSLKGSIQVPGSHGGANWGMAAGDPATGRFYVLSYDMPAFLKLSEGMTAGALEILAQSKGRGAAVYATNCQDCHGADRTGQPPLIPSLENISGRIAPPAFLKLIREGRGQMPGFPDMDATDIRGLAVYLSNVPVAAAPDKPIERKPGEPLRYRTSFGYMLSKAGNSVMTPPWQTITAYDMNSGERVWQTPVGTAPGRPAPTGSSVSKGGLVITSGGLVFAASEADRMLHAFDSRSGRHLWQGALPSRPRGGLAIYRYKGRPYIVVPAANASGFSLGELPSTFSAGRNAYIAFSL
ncbi:PQQ-binding-like beta-propeller repeat protein [Sphingopyxis sp.]|uniref:outer membrane protein assembly factor BamB family protein n=1 Tax=Sphingopyxis sp. TaxID=1908224 RepID=UPI002DF02D62|nr:PQQ-binding-like beta-propeller repeat protein [Sphingopyxis sp.]